jgi:hypothetical protein
MKKTIVLLGFASSVLLFSCQKSIDSKPQTAGSISSDATAPLNVYVAGKATGTDGRTVATYWKNGQAVTLNPTELYSSYATGIYLYGADRYVAGYQLYKGATYWKNESPSYIAFTDALTVATGIWVTGSVFVSGSTDYHPGLVYAWYSKNGVETRLNNPDVSIGRAQGVTVSGNNVYTVGSEQLYSNNKTFPRLWKNAQNVPFADQSIEGSLTAVAVAGGDVYAAGWQLAGSNHVATYWKNGVPVTLSNKGFPAEAHAVCIAGADVYVAGVNNYGTHNVAAYWKNGKLVSLTNGATDAEANSIVVDGDGNVWVAGMVPNPDGSKVAVYWKNGARVNLSKWGQDASAASIFLSRS